MSAGFTPGPWHWKASLGRTEMPVLLGADALPVCDFGMSETYYPVEGTPPEEADARLIAAAPELYEALEATHRLISAFALSGFTDDEDGRALYLNQGRISRTLAKARGEQ